MPILGKPMLELQVERIRRARRIDRLMVATSDQPADSEIAAVCRRIGVECFRGSLEDVLDRFYQAARIVAPRHVMRLTGDCPLVDPELLDALIEQHLREANDATSNALERTYPIGLDAEIFTFAMLLRAWEHAKTPSEREHVTTYMYSPGNTPRLGAMKGPADHSSWRWTVDYPEDFEFARSIFAELYPRKPAFTSEDIYELLAARPEIAAINSQPLMRTRS